MRLRILLVVMSACWATTASVQAQSNRPIRDEITTRSETGGEVKPLRSKRGNRGTNKRGGSFSSDVLKAEVMTLPTSVTRNTKALSDSYMFFSQIKNNGSKVPLIIYLHGGGGHKRDVATLTNSPIARKITQKKYPFAVLIPQYKPTSGVANGWQPDDLNLLIKHAVEAHAVDPERVFVTGSSMGGAGSWMLANKYPGVVAAVAPMSAGGAESPKGDLPVSAAILKNVAIWAFHGSADKPCPHEKIETLVKTIEAAGGKPQFTLIPGGNHGAAGKVYTEDKLYEWFLEQK
jgi:predicted peptidase